LTISSPVGTLLSVHRHARNSRRWRADRDRGRTMRFTASRLGAVASVAALCFMFNIPFASAAVDRTCYPSNFCVYKHYGYQIANPDDIMYRFAGADWTWAYHRPAINDQDSSWYNNWSVPSVVYLNASYEGGMTVCVNSGTGVWYNASANDKGSSHKWDGRGSC